MQSPMCFKVREWQSTADLGGEGSCQHTGMDIDREGQECPADRGRRAELECLAGSDRAAGWGEGDLIQTEGDAGPATRYQPNCNYEAPQRPRDHSHRIRSNSADQSEQQGSADDRQSHATFIAPVQPICGLGHQQCSLRSDLYDKSCTVAGPLQPISTKSHVEADPSALTTSV